LGRRWQIARIESGQIHLWNGRITAGDACFFELYKSLSHDEAERAARFHFGRHRRDYIICRGLLRSVLSSYLNLNPADLTFRYGPEGKPFLQNLGLHFSVSHSENRVLYALCENSELGVDIEYVRDLPEADILAKHYFSPFECAELRSTTPAIRMKAFFCCWTRKEAYIKATGKGLSIPLDSFQVSTSPAQPVTLKAREGQDLQLTNWSLKHLDPAFGYVGALAVPSPSFLLYEQNFESADECIDRLRTS
jgi:4'-phosphopantetheinyl transferase